MKTEAPAGPPDAEFLRPLRALTLVVTVVGAIASVFFMFRASAHPPLLLVILFTGWVLSPFAALLAADRISQRWSMAARATVYAGALLIVNVSLAIYAFVAFGPPRPKVAPFFLMVPAASWVLIVATLLVVRSWGGGAPRREA